MTNILFNVKMITSLITKMNKNWTWNNKRKITKINEKININIQTKKTKNCKHSLKIILEKSTQWCIQAPHSQLAKNKCEKYTNLTNSKRNELQCKKTWITNKETQITKKKQITLQEDTNNNVKGPK